MFSKRTSTRYVNNIENWEAHVKVTGRAHLARKTLQRQEVLHMGRTLKQKGELKEKLLVAEN